MRRFAEARGSVREFQIRTATAAETEAAVALWHRSAGDACASASATGHVTLVAVLNGADNGADPLVVGTVRIRESEPGIWHASHFAVAPDHRGDGRIEAELLRLAVGAARGRGAREVRTRVAPEDAPFFRRAHWRPDGPDGEDSGCCPGLPMLARLEHYWPVRNPAVGFGFFAPVGAAA